MCAKTFIFSASHTTAEIQPDYSPVRSRRKSAFLGIDEADQKRKRFKKGEQSYGSPRKRESYLQTL